MIFTSAKKIQELQDQLSAKANEAEDLKAQLADARAEIEAVNLAMGDKDKDDDKAKDKAKDEEEEEEEVKGKANAESPTAPESIPAQIDIAAKVANLIAENKALADNFVKLEASIPAQVSSVLSKMGIDPIHANKGTNDGTKDKPATSGKKGIARAAELLNEKAKR